MARLTKEQSKRHQEACALVDLDRDLSIEVAGDRVIDLCAGIGRLAYGCRDLWGRRWNDEPARQFVCVEKNPDYVKVGRKVLPEAEWVCGDVLDVPNMGLGRFDTAISNPPFGSIKRSGDAPSYTGRRFEYHVISVASQIATFGAFIIPQNSAPFRCSGESRYREEVDTECVRFQEQTRVDLTCGAGFDTSIYRDQWRGVAPKVEVVTCDFTEPMTVVAPVPSKAVAATPAARPVRPVRPMATLHLPGDQPEEQLAFEIPAA
ncbi:methyltransferase [Streptomyces zhihengii]